jgi:hypothetical protein
MTVGPGGGKPSAREDADRSGGAARKVPRLPGSISLPLDGLAYRELERESTRHGVPLEQLASFAILYYLADVDSGRIARRIPTGGWRDPAQCE